MLFWFHSAMGQVELCSNIKVLHPCKASCEPVGFYPTKSCDDFTKHHYLTWRDRWASFRPFIVQIFFFLVSSAQPSLRHLCSTKFSILSLPCTLLCGLLGWLVITVIFFFSSQKKEDNISEAYLCPLLTCVTEEYGYTRGRKKCSWNPWDLGLHCLLWEQG